MNKRILALLLSLVMLLALLPAAALAETDGGDAHAHVEHPLPGRKEKAAENTRGAATRQANFVVNNQALVLGMNEYQVGADNKTVFRPFTPAEDGTYEITSVTDADTKGYLYDADMNEINYNDDGLDGYNFSLVNELTAGTTYYVGVEFFYNSRSIVETWSQDPVPVVIRKYVPRGDTETMCGDNLYWTYDGETGALTITGTGDMWNFGWNAPWFAYKEAITSVSLPAGLTSIGSSAFYECTQLTSVTIPNKVTSIGAGAFCDCYILETVTLPSSLKTIWNWAFGYCDKLKSIAIPNGTEFIGSYCFCDCDSLESCTIPKSVKYIGDGAFFYCESLTPETFTSASGSTTCWVENGVLFTDGGKVLNTYLYTNEAEEYVIPDTVERIASYAFYGNDFLKKVEIPESVKLICYEAFYYATELESVRIPSKVRYIDEEVFSTCYALEWVVIPTTLEYVEYEAFKKCYKLADVYYTGTEEERNENLEIDEFDNEHLLDATWHYVKPTYTVTFNSDGGSAVAKQTVRVMEAAKKPANPTKRGYVFKGWYKGSTLYDFSTLLLEDVTLKAKWEKRPAFDGTVTLNPNDVQLNGKTPYVLYNGKAQKPGVIVKDKNGKTLAASQYTVTYIDNTKPGTAYADVIIKSTGAYATVWFKIYLPPTTSTTVANVQNGIQVSWKAVSGAKGYVIYRRAWNLKDAGWTTFERWNNTTKTTWVDTKVYAGTRYQYGVKAYFSDPMDNYNLGLVGPLKTTVRITTRVLNSVTPGNKKLTVKWTGSSLFTGYQIQVATDAAFTKDLQTVTVAKAKTYQTTVSKLKAKTTYYVRVRSYHVFDGTTYYGQWSNVLNGKTK